MRKSIRIYNTRTKKKDILKPLKGKKINLFVCGPTVYDFMHIGNARTAVVFDCFAKYLKSQGFKVSYVQNITDIDDKIIQRAREKGVPPHDLAEAFFKEYIKDMNGLRVDSVTTYARATHHIKEIINQIQRLGEKKFAYTLDDGIYFDISRVKSYGKLSGRTALQAEDSVSRVDYSKNKRNRGDFALWKFETTGEPSWPAPFGAGRPGWHIEDTAITEKFFGPQYDIHGGGIDLIFPHHEAEVTQMEAVSGKKPLAHYWMHTGFLTISGQKMSKSLNNFIVINQFLQHHGPYQLRFFIAKNLWRSPINYSESTMIEVRSSLERIEEFLRKITNHKSQITNKLQNTKFKKITKKYQEDFWKALADDFNTPKAFGAVFELITTGNKALDEGAMGTTEAKGISKFFDQMNAIFGIIDMAKLKQQNIPQQVLTLAAQREGLRKAKEWQKADEVRLEIEKYGYIIEDAASGPVLKKSQ